MSKLPLSGIRVLDLGHLLPGPLCSVMLADLGAEVIKIERPPRGDVNRYVPPLVHGVSPYFLMINRNKKSKLIDLKDPKGKESFLKLVESSDILIENFRPGVMKKLGVGYEKLKAVNPKLIYCAISGYGQEGPWKDVAGHDLNYLGLSGLLYPTAAKSERPVMLPTQLADIVGGSLLPALSILAALELRHKTQKGMFIDSAMMPGTMALLIMVLGRVLMTGQEMKKDEDRMTGLYPNYTTYLTRDKRAMVVAAIEPKFWNRFCDVIGKPQYADWIPLTDPTGFPTPSLAKCAPSKLKKMRGLIQVVFKTKTQRQWMKIFASQPECCCTPVNTFQEAVKFLEKLERKDLIEVPDASGNLFPQLLFAWGNPDLSRSQHTMPPTLETD